MSLATRIIPCLDVENGRVVKGVNFKNLIDAGDPVELAKLYVEHGADEITFLDISASRDNKETMLEVVRKTADVVSFTLLQEQLHSVLDTLSEREAGVVAMRFGLTDGQPKTLDEIGKVYGVTRERIRQIESKTMSKLRHPSRSQVLRDYLD